MQFWSLSGISDYETVRALQLRLVEARAADRIADVVLFLEHAPVVTRGRGLQWTGRARATRQMPMAALPPSIQFAEVERGGDLTYHGPGQLVIYPICKLDGAGIGPRHDVAGFIRMIEQIFISWLAKKGVNAGTKENATGVWVGEALGPVDHKIASLGFAVRKWVTYHGMAINVVNDLGPFQLISPCGFSPEVMTRLKDLVSVPGNWRQDLERGMAVGLSGSDSIQIREISAEAALSESNFSGDRCPIPREETAVLFE